jgi:hypothetical protein
MNRVAAVLFATVLAGPTAHAADWQTTLLGGSDPRLPKSVHYRARIVDRFDTVHTVEAWREPNRLRRSSDDRLELYANRTASGLSTVLVDKRSGRVVRGDDQVLIRAGHVEAWSELAYVLTRPAGPFELSRAGQPRRIAGATCQPYRITRSDRTAFTFCWSASLLLPLEINVPDGRRAFVVELVERRRAPEGTFRAPAPTVIDQTDDD